MINKILNPKSEIRNKFQLPKFKVSKQKIFCLNHWNLDIVSDLDIRIWGFEPNEVRLL